MVDRLSVPIRKTIRDWLLYVGAEYDIREAHHGLRTDDKRKPYRDYFVYRFQTSTTRHNDAIADSPEITGNDALITHWQPFVRQIDIECHSEDGMDVLESLLVSIHNPGVNEILDAGRIVIMDMSEIADVSTLDESPYRRDFIYRISIRVRKHARFAKTRIDHVIDTVEIDGDLISDTGETIEVSASATR